MLSLSPGQTKWVANFSNLNDSSSLETSLSIVILYQLDWLWMNPTLGLFISLDRKSLWSSWAPRECPKFCGKIIRQDHWLCRPCFGFFPLHQNQNSVHYWPGWCHMDSEQWGRSGVVECSWAPVWDAQGHNNHSQGSPGIFWGSLHTSYTRMGEERLYRFLCKSVMEKSKSEGGVNETL